MKKKSAAYQAPLIEALEPRLLYSADLFGATLTDAGGHDPLAVSAHPLVDADIALPHEPARAPLELVFVDSRAPDADRLIDDILRDAGERRFEIVRVDPRQDGLALIGETLAQTQDVAAIHLISHADTGRLALGERIIDGDELRERSDELAAWRPALDADTDILIYGCNLAADADGRAFVDTLAALTGADVAASDDPTGAASRGGDWDLEYRQGMIENELAIAKAARTGYDATLDITTGLVGRWTFDTDASDATTPAYDGTLTGNAAIDTATHPLGGASLALDGAEDYVDLTPWRNDIGALNQGAISAWVRTIDTSNTQSVLVLSDSTEDGSYLALGLYRGQPFFDVADDNTYYLSATSQSNLADGSWHHVAVTVDSSGTRLYVDGVVLDDLTFDAGDKTNAQFLSRVTQPTNLEIGVGAYNGGMVWDFNGHLDDVRVYDRALGAADVAELANRAPTDLTLTQATTVTITNPGFEDESLPADGDSASSAPGWSTNGPVGSWNPEADWYTFDAPEGLNVAYIDASTDGGSLSQQLADTFEAGRSYDLSAMVGDESTPGDSSGWELRLYAGSQLLGATSNADYDPADGEFVRATLHLSADTLSAYSTEYGQNLVIELYNQGDPANVANVHFDDVKLEYTQITIQDDIANGTPVADVASVIDPNAPNDGFSYSLTDDANGRFAIDATSGTITVADNSLLNWATATRHDIVVRATDNAGLFHEETVTIGIDAAPRTISGMVYEDVDGDGDILDDGLGAANVTLRLYRDDGTDNGRPDANDTFIVMTTTDASGAYEFTGLDPARYWVSADSKTLAPSAGFNAGFDQGDVWAEQTWGGYGSAFFNGTGYQVSYADSNLRHGGLTENRSDDASALTTAEHLSLPDLTDGDKSGVDFGFSFNVVTDSRDGDDESDANRTIQGSLRQFIDNGNAITGVQSSIFRLPVDDAGHRYYRDDGVAGQVNAANMTATDQSAIAIADIDPDFEFTWYRIQPLSALPGITDTLRLDASTQTYYAGTPLVEIDGGAAGAGVNGLSLSSGGSLVRGLAIGDFDGDGVQLLAGNGSTIADNRIGSDISGILDKGNAVDGIFVQSANNQISGNLLSANRTGLVFSGANATGNSASGNHIGTDISGTSALGNDLDGVLLTDSASGNTIGGVAASDRNLISGNPHDGILSDNGANTNTIARNYIGTDVTGAQAIANGNNGIEISASHDNRVLDNLISGNSAYGISIAGATATGNIVQGNHIGSDLAGTAALANGNSGIILLAGASDNLIGGTAADEGNLVSGNGWGGIEFQDDGTSGNRVFGNRIGTDVSGRAPLGNSSFGVGFWQGPHDNVIGGAAAGEGNLISANTHSGVYLSNVDPSTDQATRNNIVQGNKIGTDIDGANPNGDMGNHLNGVEAVLGAMNNLIGGTQPSEGNLIMNNGTGVAVTDGATGNAILGNRISENSSLGIDLNDDGVTPNDSGDPDSGSNGLQNMPLLYTATVAGSDLRVTGALNSSANTNYRIEFFRSPAGKEDASGYGEGAIYLGSTHVTTDANGDASLDIDLLGVNAPTSDRITATATVDLGAGAYGDTSEFAMNIVASAVGVSVSPVSGLTTTEGGGTAHVDFVLDAAPRADVTIALSVSDGTEASLSTNALIFTAANWDQTQTVTLTGLQDYANDGDTSYTLLTAAASSTDSAYDGLAVADVLLTNLEVANTAPAITSPVTQSIDEDTPLIFSSANGNALVVSDDDAGDNPVQIGLSANDGVLSLAGTTGLTFSAGDGTADASIQFTGKIRDINSALEGMSFFPNSDFNGSTNISIDLNDLGNSGSSGALASSANIAIDITPVNDAPSFTSSPVTSAAQDALYSYTIDATDPDGDPLTIDATTLPAWLTFTDNGDGTATLSGTPTDTEVGSHSVVLSISDGSLSDSQSFTIVVGNVNDAPSFTSTAPTSATQNTLYSYTIATTDPDGDPLTIDAPTLPAWLTFTDNGDGTAILSGTPSNTEVGNHNVVLEVSDGASTVSQAFSILVGGTNEAPLFTSTAATTATPDTLYRYAIAASDPDGDPLTITAANLPSWLTLTDHGDGSATLSGTPGSGDAGDHAIELLVSDGVASDSQSFTLRVLAPNGAPSFVSVAPTEPIVGERYVYHIATEDADGDAISITAGQLPGWLSLNDQGDGSATLSGTPGVSDLGPQRVVLLASDGHDSTSQAFTLDVTARNQAPEFVSRPVTNATEEQDYRYLVSARDVDGDPLRFSAIQLPSWLTLISQGANSALLSGHPDDPEVGDHRIVLRVSDGALGSLQSFRLTVTGVNDTPVITPDQNDPGVTEDRAPDANGHLIANGRLAIHDNDPGQSFFIAETLHGAFGTLEIAADGAWHYRADNTQEAIQRLAEGERLVERFALTTADGTQIFLAIHIDGAEDAPRPNAPLTNQTATEGQLFALSLPGDAFIDIDASDHLRYSAHLADGAPLPGWLHFDPENLRFIGSPAFADAGELHIEVHADDGLASAAQRFTLRVEALPPPAEPESPAPSTIGDDTRLGVGDPLAHRPLGERGEASTPSAHLLGERPAHATTLSDDDGGAPRPTRAASLPESPIPMPALGEITPLAPDDLVELFQPDAPEHDDAVESAVTPAATPQPVALLHLRLNPVAAGTLPVADQSAARGALHNPDFLNGLDHLKRDLDDALREETRHAGLRAETVIGLTMSLSVGVVSWVTRAGSLMAAFMSIAPIWKQLDPLPVLGAGDETNERDLRHVEDEENAVETLFDEEDEPKESVRW